MTQDLQSFIPNGGDGAGQAKVGTGVPKTMTNSNLKNFNNLKQLNNIYNKM